MVRSSGGKAWFDGHRQWALEWQGAEALIESAVLLCCRASATTREAAQILLHQRDGTADQEPTVPADRRNRLAAHT